MISLNLEIPAEFKVEIENIVQNAVIKALELVEEERSKHGSELLNIKQAYEYCGWSRNTFLKYANEYSLEISGSGHDQRVSRNNLDKMLEKHRNKN